MKKKVNSALLAFVFLAALFSSCEKEDTKKSIENPPEIPPYETMAIDFSKFSNSTKSSLNAQMETKINYGSAALTVGYWNIVVGFTLAVPVATFYESFKHTPTFIGDNKWQWTYDVKTLGATYTARLTGQIGSESIKWEMYVTRVGINAFSEFKWFEGTSALDGNSGQWLLNHSHDLQEGVLQIDWKKEGSEVGDIKYTYTRESDNGDLKQLSKNSYIQYGLQDEVLDAFYNVKYTTRDIEDQGFSDVNIEWSSTSYNGRIKSLKYFQNTDWHCWDSLGIDIDCQ